MCGISFIAAEMRRHDFDGDDPVEDRLAGLVNNAHAPCTDRSQNFVFSF